MNWSGIPKNPSVNILRQFAGGWLIFFLAWGAYLGLGKGHVPLGIGLVLIGAGIGGWGLLWPGGIRWLFIASMALAFPIGWLISQIALLLMFYGLLTPVALIFRLAGRDALGRRARPELDSYWTAKAQPRDIRRYFRQY